MVPNRETLVDSSVWIAYFDKDDTHTLRAEQLVSGWLSERTPLMLTSFVIQEVCTVLLYERKHDALSTFMYFIEGSDHVSFFVDDLILIRKTVEYAENYGWRPKLSLTDWSLMYLAFRSGMILSTFDRQLANAYARLTKPFV